MANSSAFIVWRSVDIDNIWYNYLSKNIIFATHLNSTVFWILVNQLGPICDITAQFIGGFNLCYKKRKKKRMKSYSAKHFATITLLLSTDLSRFEISNHQWKLQYLKPALSVVKCEIIIFTAFIDLLTWWSSRVRHQLPN